MPDDWMLVGRVVGAFGVRGEMKVEPLTDFPERFKKTKQIYLGTDRMPVAVTGSRTHGGQVLLRLEGIDSPEAVKALRNPELFVPRDEAHPLPDGHFYLDDIIGAQVETTDGRAVGTISDVISTGSNEVFVIGKGSDAILIPVIKDAVTELDVAAKRVVVEPWVLTTE
jgi:16S rRNA processing protein RimM